MKKGMKTGLFDYYGNEIKVGDVVSLDVDGDVRRFNVEYKTVVREVVCHPDFDDQTAKVAITGIVFSWNGYDLFPCVDDLGIPDTSRMTCEKEA